MSDTITQLENTVNNAVATSCIAGGTVIKANPDGFDPDFLTNGGLLPNGLYIRIDTNDGKHIYISAFEIDKAIGIIGDMSIGKANSADLEALATEVEHKASDIDLELVKTELGTKANKSRVDALSDSIKDKVSKTELETIQVALQGKANQTDLDDVIAQLENLSTNDRLAVLEELVGTKADASELNKIISDVNALKGAIGSVSDTTTIAAIQAQIEYLNTELHKKLEIDDILATKNTVNELKTKTVDLLERLPVVEGALTQKASTVYVQSQVSELNGAITALASKVDSKAEKVELANKADKTALHSLSDRLTTIATETNDRLERVETGYDGINDIINDKVDLTVGTALGDITRNIAQKADKTTVIENVTTLTTRIGNLEKTHRTDIGQVRNDLDTLECDLTSNITELQATVNTQSKQLETQKSQISRLQQNDESVTEKLKTEWVRVMTPEEYKRLAPIGDKFSDGTLNPFAKQANVIYMLVRYNKPISVYIGDVLIAQAEQKGSQGFAYTFPITF